MIAIYRNEYLGSGFCGFWSSTTRSLFPLLWDSAPSAIDYYRTIMGPFPNSASSRLTSSASLAWIDSKSDVQ